MLRTTPIILCVIFSSLSSFAQAAVEWVQPTEGVSVAVDSTDNVYTLNYTYALGAEMTLTKRSPDGALLWEARYDQTNPTQWERASWVSVDRYGNAIVTGTLMSGYSNPVEAASIVMKFNPEGKLRWRRVYETAFDGSSTRKSLIDAGNNIYVLGLGNGPDGLVTQVKKFSPLGKALWSYFDQGGIGRPVNFKLMPDRALVISGRGVTGTINGYAKIGLDGKKIWSYAMGGSLNAGDASGDAQGNTFLVNSQISGGTQVTKLDATGNVTWDYNFPMSGFRIEVGSDNKPVISGFPNAGTPGAAFMKVSQAGKLLWSNQNADGPLNSLLHAQMLLDRSNAAYLAAGTLFEMVVCKVHGDGTDGGTQTIPGGYARAMALGRHDDSLFVVGGTTARLSNPPSAPSRLRGTGGLEGAEARVQLTWVNIPLNETAYVIERCSGKICTDFVPMATLPPDSTSYVDGAVKRETAYRYRVAATGAGGNSPYSNIARAFTP